MKNKQKIFAVLGPTASGKSALALSLFQNRPACIINCDSQQVYADLPVGTAQPAQKDKEKLPHYLYGFIESGKQYSAGDYEEQAEEVLRILQAEEKIPVIVGGSGLYLQALLYGLDNLPEKNEALRRELSLQIEKEGLGSLYEELKSFDKDYAELIHANDSVRIIRAVEIYRLSGIRLSELRKTPKTPKYDAVLIGLNTERDILYQRINQRAKSMLSSGWIEETENLLKKGYRNWLYAFPGIGYRYIIDYLEHHLTYEDMLSLIQRDTRRYAKRQYTWFRKMENVHWVSYNSEKDIKNIMPLIRI